MHRRLILAPTPRERERWHAIWLLAQGWTASAIAEALERDPRTTGLDFRAVRAPPPPARRSRLANWNWKVVRRFVLERFGISLNERQREYIRVERSKGVSQRDLAKRLEVSRWTIQQVDR